MPLLVHSGPLPNFVSDSIMCPTTAEKSHKRCSGKVWESETSGRGIEVALALLFWAALPGARACTKPELDP